jgi:hypothetical protein
VIPFVYYYSHYYYSHYYYSHGLMTAKTTNLFVTSVVGGVESLVFCPPPSSRGVSERTLASSLPNSHGIRVDQLRPCDGAIECRAGEDVADRISPVRARLVVTTSTKSLLTYHGICAPFLLLVSKLNLRFSLTALSDDGS